MSLLVVIVNYRSARLAVDCLRSLALERKEAADFHTLVIDAASGDDSVHELRNALEENIWCDWVKLVALDRNGGFAYANNAAISPALREMNAAEYILLLNPDTVVHRGAVGLLLRFMEQHSYVGICGSRLEDPDGTTQLAARRFPGLLSELEQSIRLGYVTRLLSRWKATEPEYDLPHQTDWLPGASMMIRREVFEQIGLLDEGYFMYFEEVDFCLRAKRAGWQIWYVPESRVVHLVGQSSGVTSSGVRRRRPKYWFDSRRRYFEKNHGRVARMFADAAFILGFSLWRVRRWIQRKPDADPPRLLSDFIWHSLTGNLRP